MKSEIATGESSLVRGYAWHVYPDPATPGVFAADNPFGSGDPAPDPSVVDRPPGVGAFWKLGRAAPGVLNKVEDVSYLVLTDAPRPPEVTAGWFVEAARVVDNFELDQRGGRSVRLIRTVDHVETEWGSLKRAEYQVDRG